MKRIKPSKNTHQWPRKAVEAIQTRKRDLVVRIADWMKDKDEPAYDVEVYIGGVYDWNESQSFTLSSGLTKEQAKGAAVAFAQAQIAKWMDASQAQNKEVSNA